MLPEQRKTVCPYCGVGCGLVATTDGKRVLKLVGDPEHPANLGRLCLKGALAAQTLVAPSRLRHALVRGADGSLVPTTPEEAVGEIATRLGRILAEHGPSAVAVYLSGQLTTEAQYLGNKLGKGFLRTNHVDSNSRLCMASAAAGMTLSLGADGPPLTFADIEEADAFVFIGSNAADCHPVAFDRVQRRMKTSGARAIVVDPRRTKTAAQGTMHLAVRPGTDIALLNGWLRLCVEMGAIDEAFIAAHTEGWDELRGMLDEYEPARVAAICGISEGEIRASAEIIAKTERLISFWTMGVNQTTLGTFTTNTIINLHLATGRIGKPGAGPFSLTGQPNAMGGRDMGYMSHGLPGQRKVLDEAHRAEVEALWGLPAGSIGEAPGHDAVAMFEAMERGEIRAIWIIGTNPAASMPNLPVVRRGLERAELVIVQDAFYPTETTRFAHVVLPGALNLEQEGTFTNSDRTISLLERVAEPPGDARPDWQWVRDVARAMGFGASFDFDAAGDIFREMAMMTRGRPNDQTGVDYEILRAEGPQRWPHPHAGAPRALHEGHVFATPSGKAQFFARPYVPPEEQPDARYPLVLTTGRVEAHWHTRTKTGTVERLNRIDPAPYLAMNPEDARELGLAEGARVLVKSRRGEAKTVVRVTRDIGPGVVFMPMHWNDLWEVGASVNEVTTSETDPLSKEPALKRCAVSVERLG
ncbi:molybdopterin-dependent oxidoreductase [Polyangium spumosum]|uniref:nitrate reductase (cytochrome) n=1 Tax=Polyangium spumosum TaxID=889282 RepID=A0A6N7PU07_9BACT|nr:molybdopterin-dependent oxidoreductase [Polyangium spumosum]